MYYAFLCKKLVSKLRIVLTAALLSLIIPFCGSLARAQPSPDFDPGLAALASRLVGSIETVPFDGALHHYRGYMFGQTADAEFKRAYRRATALLPNAVRANNSWIATYGGVLSPNELLRVGSSRIVVTTTCQPHSCSDRKMFVAFDPIKTRVWGVIDLEHSVSTFGIESSADEAFLLAFISRQVVTYFGESGFPLAGSKLTAARKVLHESDGSLGALLNKLDS